MIQNEFGGSFRSKWMALLPYLFALLVSLAVHGHRRVAHFEEEDLAERESMMAQKLITRDDLESRFRQLQDDVMGRVESKKVSLAKVGVAGGIVLGDHHLPARQAQRPQEDHPGRDPTGLTAWHGDAR